jgi:hypothetical protein
MSAGTSPRVRPRCNPPNRCGPGLWRSSSAYWATHGQLVAGISLLEAVSQVPGVEIYLDLEIESDHLQGGGQIFDEQFLGLVQIIDIGVVAVAVVGQRFHHHVVQVACTTD